MYDSNVGFFLHVSRLLFCILGRVLCAVLFLWPVPSLLLLLYPGNLFYFKLNLRYFVEILANIALLRDISCNHPLTLNHASF